MKRFAFVFAAVAALFAADLAQAGGVAVVQQRVVVRSRFVVQPVLGFRQRVVVQPFVQRLVVQPFAVQQFRLGFSAGYAPQQVLALDGGCGVQAFSAGYGSQAVILRSRVCQ